MLTKNISLLVNKIPCHPGIFGVVEDGMIPGYYCYEAGQSCVGDMFNWFVKNCVPESCETEAKERGISVHQLLTEKAAALEIGESGLIALDWWNGNRTCLVDSELSGMMEGLYIKVEEGGEVKMRVKYVRHGYTQAASVENWHSHTIIENELENGDIFA